MTWVNLTFAFGSLLTSTKMTQLYDDITAQANGDSGSPQQQTAGIADAAVTTAKVATDTLTAGNIAANAIGNSELASVAVKQGNVDTSTAETTHTGAGDSHVSFVATGGTYIIGWRTRGSLAVTNIERFIVHIGEGTIADAGTSPVSTLSTSHQAVYTIDGNSGSTRNFIAEHTYITASPPYKVGVVDYPFFTFLLLDSGSNIIGSSSAKDPVWVYNGPVPSVANFYGKKGGKKVPYICKKVIPDEIKALKAIAPAAYYAEVRKINLEVVELTPEMKNANMRYTPSPFKPRDGQRVVLLAPDDPVMDFLLDVHADPEESIINLFTKGYLKLDKETLIAGQPDGVSLCKYKIT